MIRPTSPPPSPPPSHSGHSAEAARAHQIRTCQRAGTTQRSLRSLSGGGASSLTVKVARSTHSTLSKDGGRQPTSWTNQEASWPLGPMGKCMPEQSSRWFLRMCPAYWLLDVARFLKLKFESLSDGQAGVRRKALISTPCELNVALFIG